MANEQNIENMDFIVTEKKEIATQNGFMIVGSVVRKFRPKENVILLRVAVSDATGTVSHPTIAYYGKEVCDRIDSHIVITEDNKPRVRIEGYIDARRKGGRNSTSENSQKFYEWLVGTKLAFAKTAMEEATGIKGVGTRKAEGMNQIRIVGTVTGVYSIPNSSVVAVTVYTRPAQEASFPRIICLGTRAKYALENLQRYDSVSIIGYIRTREVVGENGRRQILTGLYANDIAKLG